MPLRYHMPSKILLFIDSSIFAWGHQAIVWANADVLPMRHCDRIWFKIPIDFINIVYHFGSFVSVWRKVRGRPYIEGILPKGPYPPCLRMADRALLAGYPRYGLGVPSYYIKNGPGSMRESDYRYVNHSLSISVQYHTVLCSPSIQVFQFTLASEM